MRLQSSIIGIVLMSTSASLAAAPDEKNWTGEAELGVLVTSGNTKQTNINGRVSLTQELENWRNQGELSTLSSSTSGTTTAERYSASAETDYKFSEQQFWFLRGSYDKQRFSGYRFRSSATTGYGNRVWKSGKRSFLDLTVGAGYRYNRLDMPNQYGADTEKEAIARLGGQLDYSLSKSALFRQKLSTEIGLQQNNAITESETSLQATVVDNLSMKVSYLVRNISSPPPGSVSTDTETSLSLLYGF